MKIQQNLEPSMNAYWRPITAYLYIVVCAFDFVIAPILWSLLQAHYSGTVSTPWNPLTLQGAGYFHVAMGAIIGITAYGRTQEKLNGVAGIVANVSQLAPTVLHINEPTEQTELQLKPPVVVKKSFTHCAKPIPPENTTSPESTV